jgi:glycosyltransferase involved in cell wall biosynthesis
MRIIVRHVGADYDRRQWGLLAKAMFRAGERFAARYAESIVCLNSRISERFSQTTGRTVGVFTIPNGVERPPSTLPDSVLHRLGIGREQYILSVSRLVSDKNVHILVHAFTRARLPGEVKLIIVGSVDRQRSYFRSLMKLCARHPRVVVAGGIFSTDLLALYKYAGLFVLPSAHEGMSFSLLEASIAGIKIVASNIPANADVCSQYARLVSVDSIQALCDGLEAEWFRERADEEMERQIQVCSSRHNWNAIASTMTPILLPRDRDSNRNDSKLDPECRR